MPKTRTSLFTPVLLVGCFIMFNGFVNIGGTLFAGYLGKRYPKKYLRVGIYTGRTYTAVWWVGVTVGAFSAIVQLPIRENRCQAQYRPPKKLSGHELSH